jgi:hypothetical protein
MRSGPVKDLRVGVSEKETADDYLATLDGMNYAPVNVRM